MPSGASPCYCIPEPPQTPFLAPRASYVRCLKLLLNVKNHLEMSKGAARYGCPIILQGVAYSLRRRLHDNPFGRNRKGARGDYVPIRIEVGVIA
jgi:hypothetical protein